MSIVARSRASIQLLEITIVFTAEIAHDAPAGVVILKLTGEAGVTGIADLDRATLRLAAQRPKLIVIDCNDLTFMSSLAMGSLVAMSRAIRSAGGRVIIAAASRTIIELLQRTRLDEVFPIYESVEHAAEAFGQTSGES